MGYFNGTQQDNGEEMIEGQKQDSQKPRWSLLVPSFISGIIEVMELGAKKYSDNNWKKVPDLETRYYDAAMRHINAWWIGEKSDPETGKSHLLHAACCLMFLFWNDKAKIENTQPLPERELTMTNPPKIKPIL